MERPQLSDLLLKPYSVPAGIYRAFFHFCKRLNFLISDLLKKILIIQISIVILQYTYGINENRNIYRRAEQVGDPIKGYSTSGPHCYTATDHQGQRLHLR